MLARPDIDAVIIATPDHWHATITKDALAADKDVYCEKPMVKKISEGREVIEAHKKTDRILQVGSQYASSIVFQKAAQLMKSGAIGQLNMVEAWLDRNTAVGAWQYSIPPDASPVEYRLGSISRQRSQAPVRTDPFIPLAQLQRLRHRFGRRSLRSPAYGPSRRHGIDRAHAHLLLRRHSILEGRARCSGRDAGCAGLSEDGRSSRVHLRDASQPRLWQRDGVIRIPIRGQRRPDDGGFEWSDA